MTEHEMEVIVQKAVHHTLLGIGFDMSKPTKIQEDISFLRKTRERCETWKTRAELTFITLAVTGLVTVLVTGIKLHIGG